MATASYAPTTTLTGPSATQTPAAQPYTPPAAQTPPPNALGTCDPFNNPDQWSVITFGGTKSPGKCVVGEFTRKYKFDTKEGKGTAGAISTLTGLPPANGKITFWMWQASQCPEWDSFVALLKQYPTKGAVNSATIYHPALADIDITQVTTTEISSWVPTNPEAPDGYFTRWIELLEFNPPPPINITDTPSAPSEGTPPPASNDPNAADQAELAALQQQLQQPQGG